MRARLRGWQAISSVLGLAASTIAAAWVALLVAPTTPGRLAYYAVVAGGSTARLAGAAVLGCLFAAPAAALSRGRLRWLSLLALGLGALSAAISGALAARVFCAANSRGLHISLRENIFGSTCASWLAPEPVTFTSRGGRHLGADLYRPPGVTSPTRPLASVVVVHGGAWRWGDKGENADFSRWLATSGYLVLDIQYGLAPSATWDQAVRDIRSGVAWLRAHAAELGADPHRIALLGRSAGGHLSLLAAYALDDDHPPLWRVISFYAPVDLTRLYVEAKGGHARDLREGLRASLGGDPTSASLTYRLASPLDHVHAGAPPTLLIHGTWDSVVPPKHCQLLTAALDRAGVPVRSVLVPGARHAFDLLPDGLATQLTRAAVAAFLSSDGRVS